MFVCFYLGAPFDYTVTVASDPAEGEVSIGSTLTLYCNVQPEAPQGAVYEWSTSVSFSTIIYSTFPNATVAISFSHPSVSHYYCYVYDHEVLIGVGSIALEVISKLNTLIAIVSLFICFVALQALYTHSETTMCPSPLKRILL